MRVRLLVLGRPEDNDLRICGAETDYRSTIDLSEGDLGGGRGRDETEVEKGG